MSIDNWQTKRLDELLIFKNGINFTRHEKGESGVLTLDVLNMYPEGTAVEMSDLYRVHKDVKQESLLQSGDILFVRSSVKREGVAYAATFKGYSEPVSYCGFIIRGRPSEEICSDYLIHFLRTNQSRQKLIQSAKTGTITNISQARLAEIEVPIPPIAQQKRIAAILDEAFAAIDKAKQNAEKNLTNAKKLFESYLDEAFVQKDVWDQLKLSEVALTFGRGKSRHRPRNDKSLYGGKYPFIQTGDIRKSDHYVNEFTQTYNEKGLAQSKLWPEGTLCITIAANIAETAILSFESCIPDSVIGLVCNPAIANVDFTKYLLQHFKAGLQAEGKGAAQDNINLGTFERVAFPFPSINEQQKIVCKLNDIAKTTQQYYSATNRKIDMLNELKQSILKKAFMGQLTSEPKELELV